VTPQPSPTRAHRHPLRTDRASIATATATGTIVNDDLQTLTLQPGPEGQDVWVTNVYSYNDNYGVDDDRLRVGGWGDYYDSSHSV